MHYPCLSGRIYNLYMLSKFVGFIHIVMSVDSFVCTSTGDRTLMCLPVQVTEHLCVYQYRWQNTYVCTSTGDRTLMCVPVQVTENLCV